MGVGTTDRTTDATTQRQERTERKRFKVGYLDQTSNMTTPPPLYAKDHFTHSTLTAALTTARGQTQKFCIDDIQSRGDVPVIYQPE